MLRRGLLATIITVGLSLALWVVVHAGRPANTPAASAAPTNGQTWQRPAPVEPVAAAVQPQQQPGQPIIIRWSTESEVNTAGYNLYRAGGEEGPWSKINDRLIPASPDPLRGGNYVYTDTAVVANQTYWYELEEVELSGTTTRLERTQATAAPLASNPLASLPCAGGLLLVGLGVVVTVRKFPRASAA